MASALLFYLLLSTPLLPGVGSHASLGTFGHNYLSHLRLRGGDHDSMSPFDVSELKAFDVSTPRPRPRVHTCRPATSRPKHECRTDYAWFLDYGRGSCHAFLLKASLSS